MITLGLQNCSVHHKLSHMCCLLSVHSVGHGNQPCMLPKMRQQQRRSSVASPCQRCCLSHWVHAWQQHKEKACGSSGGSLLVAAGRFLSRLAGEEGGGEEGPGEGEGEAEGEEEVEEDTRIELSCTGSASVACCVVFRLYSMFTNVCRCHIGLPGACILLVISMHARSLVAWLCNLYEPPM